MMDHAYFKAGPSGAGDKRFIPVCFLLSESASYGSGRKDGRFALRFGTSKINIHICPGEFQPAAERPVPGSLDICFVTEEPLERLLDELKEEKAPLVTDIVERHGALGKMRSLYLRDPDGNLVEIAEYRKGGQHAYHQSG